MRFSWSLVLVASGLSLMDVSAMAAGESKSELVYFGTYTGEKSRGIYSARFDPHTGELSSLKLAAETKNPTFLALSADEKFLFAANEVGNFGGKNSGAVSSFRVSKKTGELELVSQEASGGSGPCHVSVDGDCLVVANYGSGSVAAYRVDKTGRIIGPGSAVQHHGSSVNRQRQEGPHAHFITPSPDNHRILSCDLGLDQVLIYRLEREGPKLILDNVAAIRPGAGPRHLAFHPNKKWVYVINELNSTITVCDYDSSNGKLLPNNDVSTLAESFHGNSSCAEIAVHPSGKWVYGSNRGENTIAVFAVDAKTGDLRPVGRESTRGKTPRHFAMHPSGNWLIAENQDSNDVFVFRVDNKTGLLSPVGGRTEVGAPVCLVFVR